jgi:hypothetical protein
MPRPRQFRAPRSFGAPTALLRGVIMTIDAAKRSGVAMYVNGCLHHYCEVQALEGPQRRRVVQDASTIAEVRGLPLACVIEVPWRGGHISAELALTAVVALWRDTWRGAGLSAESLLEYTANDWRRALFGTSGMPRAEVRRLEAATAAQTAHRDMPSARHYTIGPDAAAAICIGQVAIRSGAVAAALGCKSTLRRNGTV